jgi:hypothetical protein
MSAALPTVVIGKQTTLLRPGVVAPHELVLDWPNQRHADRNWARNRALLARVIAAGHPIRDVEIAGGRLRGNTGFLARERAQMRDAGLRLDADGFWRRPPPSALLALAPRLLARAASAAAAGERTFAVPEAAPVAAWIATRVADPDVRAEAAAWRARGASYHDLVRLAARAALALDRGDVTPVYRPKAAAELEPMLALWPRVLAVPTTVALSPADMIRLRALPVHPLGLVARPTWADGSLLSPSEYLFHDLDHARFKLREDCLAWGADVPDAYVDGSTLDARSGRHRSILPAVVDRIGAWPANDVPARWTRVQRLLAGVRAARDRATARAAELLLFEVVHEKGLPASRPALAQAFASDAHIVKLWRKHTTGFFGVDDPDSDVMNALSAARALLAGGAAVGP